ncbi:MAG: hypothetical protein HC892_19575 [Saprospiraceae bacterium]|nr:hypothetical protein [Saprospiraceae bacterium]
MYDPVLGRFTSADPLSAVTPRWTPYRYGFNNPLIMTDPTGMSEVSNTYSDGYGTISGTASVELWTDSRGSEPTGDIYNKNGKWIGSDGRTDGRVYIHSTYDDRVLDQGTAGALIDYTNVGINTVLAEINVTHSELQTLAAAAYGEAGTENVLTEIYGSRSIKCS